MTAAEGALVGPYRLGRLLGRGGMAVVYEATHEDNGRTVALKLVSSDLTDASFTERFRNEGRMQAALHHPHVVSVYEAGTSEYGPYLAMRLVRGTTLAQLIDQGVLDSARALDLVGQVAEALDAAHANGLVHRDVKPRNVLVGEADHAYLADFGLTKRSDVEGPTVTGHFLGTLAYVAPEVVRGGVAGPAADRYALAAVLFECLTGTTVFPRPTEAGVVYAHTSEPPPRVSGRREGIPAAVDEALIAGLAKEPADRPPTATALVAAVRTALAGRELGPPAPRVLPPADDTTTPEHPALPPAAAPGGSRRRRHLVLAATAIVAALAGAGAVALLDGEGAAPPAEAALAPAPAGTQRLGSDLAHPGRAVDCSGGPVRAGSVACTIFQTRLSGATLVVPRNGVVRRWGVRSATGELALAVLRPRDDGYFQVTRSRNEFVGNDGPHLFATDLAVDQGDMLAVQVVGGSGVGMRAAAGATTGRWTPPIAGAIAAPKAGSDGELLLRADYQPGGTPRRPARLDGAAAAAAPDGEVLVRRRGRFTNGRPFEVRVVGLDGGGVFDLLLGGRRVTRIGIPGLQTPLDTPPQVLFWVEKSVPEQAGIGIRFTRAGSDRLVDRYFDVTDGRLEFVD